MLNLTMEQATVIAKAAIEIGNATAIAQNMPGLVREYNSFDAATQAMAITGIVRTVEAMQRVGFKITHLSDADLERHPPPVADPQGLVTSSADGLLTHIYPTTEAPSCDALTLTTPGVEKLIALLQSSLKRRAEAKEGE